MAIAPIRGPGASSTKAYCQPIRSATTGTSWMLTTVSRKPIAVCAVRAVPTNLLSVVSDRTVEKTPESAITAAPQISRKTMSTHLEAVTKIGEATQHAPLIVSAATAAGERPNRSDTQPPRRQPAAPATPIAANAMKSVDAVLCCPARMNIGNQAHSA